MVVHETETVVLPRLGISGGGSRDGRLASPRRALDPFLRPQGFREEPPVMALLDRLESSMVAAEDGRCTE